MAAIDPDFALQLAKGTADIYGQAVADLLAVVARRLAAGIDEPGWAELKLIEQAGLRDEAQTIVERLQSLGPKATEAAIHEAAERGAVEAVKELKVKPSLHPVTNRAGVEALVKETVAKVQRTHHQILRSVDDIYRSVVAETAAPGVVTGSATTRQAAQRALDRFASNGITGFVDQAGRKWEIESYTEMAVRTSSGRAQITGRLDVYTDNGRDLVIASNAPQECKACRPWEGKVLSISGHTTGQLDDGTHVAGTVAQARSAGLQHANCRHDLRPYIVGFTKPFDHTEDPEGDRARQEQRRLERGVREWKRREAVALDPVAGRAAAAKRKEWTSKLTDHIQANDLKRQRSREAPRLSA